MGGAAGGEAGRRAKGLLVLAGLLLGALLSAALLLLFHRSGGGGKGPRQDELARELQDHWSIFAFDTELSFRLRPRFTGTRDRTEGLPHRTNSLGLLGEEELARDPAVPNVLFLGDSVAYGSGVAEEETFVARMRGAARRHRLWNGSCPGWSTWQELLYYDRYLKGQPVSAVVVVFALNDLMRYEWIYDPARRRTEKSGELVEALSGAGRAARLGLLRERFSLDSRTAPLARHDGNFLSAWDEGYWERYEADLPGLLPSDTSRVPFVFVAVPTPHQLAASLLGAPDDLVFYPQRRLARFCRGRRIPFVDASPPLLREAPREIVFLDDCHLTAKGHEILSAHLWDRLRPLLPGGR